jgi:ABC-2 type transport system ATP-binding protein
MGFKEFTMVEMKDLCFGYGKEPLFSNLDLGLEAGNIYGLLGKNGAGKTTLLKLIAGLRSPQAGRCRTLGFSPPGRLPGMLEEIYLIPEEFYTPPLTMDGYAAIYAPFFPRFDRGLFADCRREFNLTSGKKLTAFSYGQKKKFLLAFGIASGCRLLLLDEPTNGLDIPSKSQFRRLLAAAVTEERLILISTHQVRDMENLIDPIIILDEGRIIYNRSLEETARHISIRLEQEAPDPDAATLLYSATVLGGYVAVRENRGREESRIDLETLFNAVTANSDEIEALFEREA